MTQETKRKIHKAAQVVDTYLLATGILVGIYVAGFMGVVTVMHLFNVWGW